MRLRNAFTATCLVILSLSMAEQVDAAPKKQVRKYAPPYAAMAVDLYTGRVLHAQNADAPRYPASLTKVMTLYLLFDALREGKLQPETRLPVSEFAASQVPTKISLKPGDTISVKDAVGALITKSANDVAVVVAEALAGTQEEFARRMTQKARQIGMTNTTFRNASGLPHPEQRSTARDLIILARSIIEEHAERCKSFRMKHFAYNGRVYRNHNSLLFSYRGMEGMKTGFTNASGFNLIASAARDDKRVLAAVLGGPSARSRDAAMRNILNASWKKATTEKAARKLLLAAAPVPEARGKPTTEIAAADGLGTRASASAPLLRNTPQVRAVAEVIQQPLQPLPVTPAIQPEPPARQAASTQPIAIQPVVSPAPAQPSAVASTPPARVVTASAAFGAMPSLEGALPPAVEAPKPTAEQRKPFSPGRGALYVEPLKAEELEDETVGLGYVEPIYAEAGSDTSTDHGANLSVHMKAARVHAAHALVETAAEAALQPGAVEMTPAPARTVLAAIQGDAPRSLAAIQANEAEPASNYAGPYHIQVGAFDNVASAELRHKRVQEIAGEQLRGRIFFLMPVQLGEAMLIRARFAGFEERDAKRVCALLKRRAIECMVLRAPSDENSAVRPSP